MSIAHVLMFVILSLSNGRFHGIVPECNLAPVDLVYQPTLVSVSQQDVPTDTPFCQSPCPRLLACLTLGK
jgi:hypothetical protein